MALTTILEEKEINGFYSNEGLYGYADIGTNVRLTGGETYHVKWDGTEYICVAVEDSYGVAIGNWAIVGAGSDTSEPFFMAYCPPGTEAGYSDYALEIITTQEGETHTLAIYLEEAEAEPPPSATVKIKGYSGAEFTYESVPKVWLAAPESTVDNPVLVPFTYGEAVDGVEVTPDFSAGDQTVEMDAGTLVRSMVVKKPDTLIPGNIKAGETVAGITGDYDPTPETEELTQPADFSDGDMVLQPSEGKYLSKATVTMPESLIPENIAEGVDIAGIVGKFTGGANVKLAFINTAWSREEATYTHDLGVVPDIIFTIVRYTWSDMTETPIVLSVCAASSAFKDKYGKSWNVKTSYDSGKWSTAWSGPMDTATSGGVYNVTETTFTVPAYLLDSIVILIGGLT